MSISKRQPVNSNDGEEPEPVPTLSDRDRAHLAILEARLQLVRDFVGQVAAGRSTGLYLYGEGGIGKSHTVIGELERLRADYKVHNSRMNGRGLFNALQTAPDSIHLLEDMEQVTRDRNALGVLRSALWAQRKDGGDGPMERAVTWSTYKMEHRIVFTGGIIMTANRPLAELPELQAIKTRIPCMQLRATDGEMTAMMRRVALDGFRQDGRVMSPDECLEVCEFLVVQSRSLQRPLDMRMLVNSFTDFLTWRECETGCHWHDLAATRLKERPTTFASPPDLGTRADRRQRELDAAREIAATTSDRAGRKRLWAERTRKSEATFYRRLDEIGGR